MSRKKRYNREFKLQACKLVIEQGYSLREAAERLGATSWSIRMWIKGFRESGDIPPKDQPIATADELKQLRKENMDLRMENEILKKATAYFAKDQV